MSANNSATPPAPSASRQRLRRWGGIVVAIPVVYVLAFGPAFWLVDKGRIAAGPVARYFRPLVWALHQSGDPIGFRSLGLAYAGLGATAPAWTLTRLVDAAGLEAPKSLRAGPMNHDVRYSSIEEEDEQQKK